MLKVGSVKSIVRYPVKSMAGEEINEGFIGFAGLFGDRAFAFTYQGGKPGFPWFTIRQLEDLVRFKATFKWPDKVRAPVDLQASLALGPGVAPLFPQGDAFDVEVAAPSGEVFSIRDDGLREMLEGETGEQLSLRFSERSLSDCRPVSLFAGNSLRALEAEIGVRLDARRFRANLYVDWDDAAPFYENDLMGRVLQIGSRARIMVTERDPRCKIVTIDPDTADETPKILRHITSAHGGSAGVYGAVLFEGAVRNGDPICVV
ncbi:MOSC domain-containing protein [Bradyrhizobium sp.]|uniref:MOSC domain-containing protein n=1 Tax=Bradyrhizobium sp. TaxID=376 RepID=UPI0039E3A1A2